MCLPITPTVVAFFKYIYIVVIWLLMVLEVQKFRL